MNCFLFSFFFNWLFRSTLAALYDQFEGQQNETAGDAFFNKIGQAAANRMRLELVEEAKNKATSANFEKMRILLEKYHTCKSRS